MSYPAADVGMKKAAAADAGVPLATPRIGQTLDYASVASFHERWWEAYE